MKKQGYYSWIHSMKNAAMEARNKGIQMISEQKAQKITNQAKLQQLTAQLAPPAAPQPAINPEDNLPVKPTSDPKDIKASLSGLGKTTPHSLALGGGDVGAYVQARRMKHAEILAQKAANKGPINAAPAGGVGQVVQDAQDGVMADPEDDMDAIPDGIPDITLNRVPSYPVAAQARVEAGRGLPGDIELAKKAEPPLMSVEDELKMQEDEREAEWEASEEDRLLSGYTGRSGERYVPESVTSKIKRMLNEA